jgi:hypothetical protein
MDNDVLLYMDKLAKDMVTALNSTTRVSYKVRSGFHTLKKEDIGQHVYYIRACESIRKYVAIYNPEETGKDVPRHVWRIYFGCVTDQQRWDVASLVSTIKDRQAG